MKALLDLNVLLDVIQNRQPHYADSATVLSASRSGEFVALIPFHAVTTIFYLIERAQNTATASQTVDWLFQHFEIPAVNKNTLVEARRVDDLLLGGLRKLLRAPIGGIVGRDRAQR